MPDGGDDTINTIFGLLVVAIFALAYLSFTSQVDHDRAAYFHPPAASALG